MSAFGGKADASPAKATSLSRRCITATRLARTTCGPSAAVVVALYVQVHLEQGDAPSPTCLTRQGGSRKGMRPSGNQWVHSRFSVALLGQTEGGFLMAKKRKGRLSSVKPAGPDDPIYKEGLTIFTPRSARGSTKSTPSKPTVKPPANSSRLSSQGAQGIICLARTCLAAIS